jgi:Peptidase_G2, IMC autoproteolytic cleavage domain
VDFDIFTHSAGTGDQTSISIDTDNGYVGIGKQIPASRLHVAGSVTVDANLTAAGTISGGTIYAKYQDVAEWVPAREALQPGTVVVVDGARTNGVVASGSAYDTRVAGVVSDSPGVVLGEAGEGKTKVATTGRVKVRVTAVEPIHVGDLLVTSAVGGVAMKSIPLSLGGVPIHRPGTLIGKALEPLSEGEGEILVLLSLQ